MKTVCIIIIGITIILKIFSQETEELEWNASIYGYPFDNGVFINLRERNELKSYIEDTNESNYAAASSMIDEMVASGYNVEEIPLILYSGVTNDELSYISELHNDYMSVVEQEKLEEQKEAELIQEEENQKNDDSDGDGVTNEFDICDGGNDLVDENYNYIPDDCDVIESQPIEVEEDTSVSTQPEEIVDETPTDPADIEASPQPPVDENTDSETQTPPNEGEVTPPTDETDGETDPTPPIDEGGDGSDIPVDPVVPVPYI